VPIIARSVGLLSQGLRVVSQAIAQVIGERQSRSNASSSMLSESRSILAILASCFALATGKVGATRTVRILSAANNYRVRFH
jgi:hypothetical protein